MKKDLLKNIFPSKKNVFLWAFAISLLFHVGVLLKTVDLTNLIKQVKTPPKKEKRRLKVVMRKKSDDERNQIVQAQKDKKEKQKKETRFLSHSDQTVDRETVSKNIGKFKEAGKGSKQATKSQPTQKPQAKPQANPTRKAISKKSKKKTKTSKDISWEALAKASQKEAKKALERSVGIQKGIKRGVSGKSGVGQSNDHIEDIPLGDMTQLNTVEYKYYGFYNRIREKLERYWGKSLKAKAKSMHKGRNRMPASENKTTSLVVTLDSKGQIMDIKVNSTSGVRAFDEAAVESFSKAGPFPNPPSGMVKNGKAQIKWGFVVKG